MRHNNYMPLFVGDYLRDTGHLTTCEHGAYLLLLMHYWSTGGLPENEDCIRRITKMNNTMWARSRDTLAALFKPGWRHTRLEKELAHAHEVSAARAESGAKGAAAKGRKLTSATNSKTHLATELENEPKQLNLQDAKLANAPIPNLDKKEEGIAKAIPNRAREGPAFARFWSVWPNKVQRTYAEKCFAKVAAEVDQIVAGVERYVREKPPDRQWLNPSTYLNQRRWEDQPSLPINGNSHGQRNGKNSLVDAADDLVEKIRLRKMRSGECGDISGTVIPLLPRL